MQDLAGGCWQRTHVDLVIDLVQHVGNRRCQSGGSSQPHAADEQCDQRHRAERRDCPAQCHRRYSLYGPSGLSQSRPMTMRRFSTGGSSAAPSVIASESSGDCVRRGLQHRVADPLGFRHRHAEAQAREDQRIVGPGLSDACGPRRRPARTGCRWRPTPVPDPADQVTRERLSLRGRVGQRHDDGSLDLGRHLLDDLLGERGRLRRGADQHGGPSSQPRRQA